MGVQEAYQKKADAQLNEWRAWIEHYRSHLDHKTANHRRFVELLTDSYRAARQALDRLLVMQDAHWESGKQAVERAMIDLKRLLDESGAAQNAQPLKLQSSRKHMYEPFEWKGK